MKDILNFILGLLTLVYVTVIILNVTGVIDLASLVGGFTLLEIMMFAPIFMLGAFSLVSFASKSFKLIFFVLMVIALIIIVLYLIDPTFFGLIAA